MFGQLEPFFIFDTDTNVVITIIMQSARQLARKLIPALSSDWRKGQHGKELLRYPDRQRCQLLTSLSRAMQVASGSSAVPSSTLERHSTRASQASKRYDHGALLSGQLVLNHMLR